jgi:hypothetical protein
VRVRNAPKRIGDFAFCAVLSMWRENFITNCTLEYAVGDRDVGQWFRAALWRSGADPQGDGGRVLSRTWTLGFHVSHGGPLALTVSSTAFECGTYETFWADVRKAGPPHPEPTHFVFPIFLDPKDPDLVAAAFVCNFAGGTFTRDIAIEPGDFELEIVRLYPQEFIRTNTVTLSYPR